MSVQKHVRHTHFGSYRWLTFLSHSIKIKPCLTFFISLNNLIDIFFILKLYLTARYTINNAFDWKYTCRTPKQINNIFLTFNIQMVWCVISSVNLNYHHCIWFLLYRIIMYVAYYKPRCTRYYDKTLFT